jgi:hypothetical protein
MVIFEHVSHILKSKFNPRQHGFTKSKYTSTNLVGYLDFVSPLVHSLCHSHATYFDFNNAFHNVPHTLSLRKLGDFGLTAVYVIYLHNYLTNSTSRVRYRGALSSNYDLLSGVPQESVLGPFLSIYSYMTCGVVKYSNCLLLADYIKIYGEINPIVAAGYSCLI